MARPPLPIPYRGSDITVRFDPALCIHSGECTRGLPDVFNTKEKPWVHPDRNEADAILTVICRCPSGALSVERHDSGVEERPDAKATVAIRPSGPLHIRGAITVEMEDGSKREMTRLSLCRCGASKNKPFCDNSHRISGFSDPGTAPMQEEMPETIELNTPITLRPQVNGPVLFTGPLEVRTPRGEVCFRGAEGSLCRCGGSQTKPFCDGAHNTNGFISA